MDPVQGIAAFILGKMKQSAMALWLKLLFELSLGATVSFLLGCGLSLVASRDWALSVGIGMILSAVSMTELFRRSELTKKFTIIIPTSEISEEQKNGMEVIQK